tara:strand:- start:48 stop:269 length:222 start_codon:yes stop_codon:yes gene_type:complete
MDNIFNNIKNNKNKYDKLKLINYTIDKINIDIDNKKNIISKKIDKNNEILKESILLYYNITQNLDTNSNNINN